MTKRILDATASDFRAMSKADLLESIRLAEGRTINAEVVCTTLPLIDGVTNAELAAACGADLITLNLYDVQHPIVMGYRKGNLPALPEFPLLGALPIGFGVTLNEVKALVGRPVGINLEPVPPERVTEAYRGRVATVDNARRAVELGADYLVLTGNPGSGVSVEAIERALGEIAAAVGDRVILVAGKMHGAGLGAADIAFPEAVSRFAAAGADIVLVPAPGTTPGATLETIKSLVDLAHQLGKLALSAIGTSQEGAEVATVRHIALLSKMTGADIHHIGDAGYAGVANPENIIAFSIAVRGRRHTYRRMAASIAR
ncbi:MAG: haloacid dehalogenase-like hydrolase [Chloroflexi bacterium]|nr:haloacid dehalogenase-like hydrolase [Chloroflexota bacterium]